MVSGGHTTFTRMVSCILCIVTRAPPRTISRAIVSRTTNVSTTRRSAVTIVVSTRTMVSLAIVGSFASARFRCHDAPHDDIIDAVITTTHHLFITPHTNRILPGCQCCTLVVRPILIHQWNRWMNLPNRCHVLCSLFAFLLWVLRKEKRECHANESAEFGQWCFIKCDEQCTRHKDDPANNRCFDVGE